MNSEIQIISIAGSLLMMYLVFNLIRRRRLREEYALLWFAAGTVLMVFSFWRNLLDTVARWVGIAYPPTVLLLGVIVLGFLLAMHYSVSLSRLAEQNKRLAQEVALLRHQLDGVRPAAVKTELDNNQLTLQPPAQSSETLNSQTARSEERY